MFVFAGWGGQTFAQFAKCVIGSNPLRGATKMFLIGSEIKKNAPFW